MLLKLLYADLFSIWSVWRIYPEKGPCGRLSILPGAFACNILARMCWRFWICLIFATSVRKMCGLNRTWMTKQYWSLSNLSSEQIYTPNNDLSIQAGYKIYFFYQHGFLISCCLLSLQSNHLFTFWNFSMIKCHHAKLWMHGVHIIN